MPIFCLGLNHRTAPVSLREKLAFSADQVRAALARLGCGQGPANLREMVIVSTCNRMEIYVVAQEDARTALLAWLEEVHEVSLADWQAYFYWLADMDAAHHLFRVAAGLDSLVIGEPQILGQVTQALELARGQDAAGPLLNRLFQSAIHAGKRARTETRIAHNPASVASLAAAHAAKAVGDLKNARVAVLGAGEMAELTVEALRKRGTTELLLINRTLERARRLAERWGGQAATFEHLESALAWADVLIASTGAPHTLVHAEMVNRALRQRPQRPLVVVDIAVPRDVDPEVGRLPGVYLYDIDHLNQRLEDALAARRREAPRVEAILAEELEDFFAYLRSLDMLPLIADLSAYAEQVRQAEVEKTLRRLPDLSAQERERIEKMSRALVKKLLSPALRQLRVGAGSPQAADYAWVVRQLFNLPPKEGDVVHSLPTFELQETL